jgi:acetyltransferase-like isoleucine patch superfamily enzyme
MEKGILKVGEGSLIGGLKLEIRKNDVARRFMTIGNESIVNGNFIFETVEGTISIGDNTFIGGGRFICIDGIEIGNDVLFSWGCTVVDNNSHSLNWNERSSDVMEWKIGLEEGKIGLYKNWENVKHSKVVVKNKAWVGFDVIILKGVTIGEGSVVAAGSVVTKNVPDWTIVGGNPAKIIRHIEESERK